MGGIVVSSSRYGLELSSSSATEKQVPKTSRDSFRKSGSQSQQLTSRQQIFDHYSHVLINQFQQTDRENNEKLRKVYANFLTACWLSSSTAASAIVTTPTTNNTTPSSPHAESAPSRAPMPISLRQEFDALVMETLTRKVPAVEVYDTVFADYYVILKNDAQNKVVMFTQLKTRDAASYTVNLDDSEFLLSNPLLTNDQAIDLLLLAFWPIFNDFEIAGKLPTLVTQDSFYRKLNSFRRNAAAKSKQGNDQEVTVSLLFKPVDESTENTEKPKRRKSSIGLPPNRQCPEQTDSASSLCDTVKPFVQTQPSASLLTKGKVDKRQRDSWKQMNAISHLSCNNLPKNSENTVPISIKPSKLDLERYRSIMTMYDRISTFLANNPSEFAQRVKNGKWKNCAMFFSHLENIDVPLAIQDVTVKGSYPLIYVNNAWEVITGHRREDVIGKDMKSILTGASTEKGQLDKIDYCLEEGLGLKVVISHHRKDQSAFCNFLSLLPVYDAQDDYRFAVTRLYDAGTSTACLTEIKYAEEIMYLVGLALRYLS